MRQANQALPLYYQPIFYDLASLLYVLTFFSYHQQKTIYKTNLVKKANNEGLVSSAMQITNQVEVHEWLLAIVYVVITSLYTTQALSTSCDISGKIGEAGKLVVHFSEDIRHTHITGFAVQRYDLDPSDNNADTILSCVFAITGIPTCHVNGAYRFDGQVSSEVLVDIPRVTKEVEGRYQCQLVHSYKGPEEFCILDLKDKELSASSSSESPTTLQTTTVIKSDSATGVNVGAIVGAVFGGLVTAAIIVWALVRLRKQLRNCCRLLPCLKRSEIQTQISLQAITDVSQPLTRPDDG